MQQQVSDHKKLPTNWPTHKGSAAFWEELGRAVACFGFLEDTLTRTYFALTATRRYKCPEEVEKRFEKWKIPLELSITDSLGSLVIKIDEAFKDDDRISEGTRSAVVDRLNEVRVWRNALCHGTWDSFAENGDSAHLRFFRKTQDGPEQLSNKHLQRLEITQIRRATAEVTSHLINIVTSNGLQFPGSTSPGRTIL